MISAGYKSAYQQGYSDAMRDFRKKSKTDVLDKIKNEIIARDRNVKSIRIDGCCFFTAEEVFEIIDKYKAESEEK